MGSAAALQVINNHFRSSDISAGLNTFTLLRLSSRLHLEVAPAVEATCSLS